MSYIPEERKILFPSSCNRPKERKRGRGDRERKTEERERE